MITIETEFSVTGLPELDAKFKALPDKLQNRILKKACKEGAMAVLHTARSLTPVLQTTDPNILKRRTPGALVADLRIKPTSSRSKGTVGYKMIVGGHGFFEGKQFYGGFMEFGWHPGKRPRNIARAQRAIRKLARRGRNLQALVLKTALDQTDTRDFIEGEHFCQRAAEQNQANVVNIFQNALRTRLGEAIQ
jgi:HK97 gp10 family phage protein